MSTMTSCRTRLWRQCVAKTGNKLVTKSTTLVTKSTVSVTVNFVADLSPLSATVNFVADLSPLSATVNFVADLSPLSATVNFVASVYRASRATFHYSSQLQTWWKNWFSTRFLTSSCRFATRFQPPFDSLGLKPGAEPAATIRLQLVHSRFVHMLDKWNVEKTISSQPMKLFKLDFH